jgi:hypothetical protein
VSSKPRSTLLQLAQGLLRRHPCRQRQWVAGFEPVMD